MKAKLKAKQLWQQMNTREREKALRYYCNPMYQVHHKCEHGGRDFAFIATDLAFQIASCLNNGK